MPEQIGKSRHAPALLPVLSVFQRNIVHFIFDTLVRRADDLVGVDQFLHPVCRRMNETKNYSITKSGAVILEGGANRGVFTAGALDFLMEQEYYIPHVIGVSAGACNALDYVSRQIGRTRDCMIVTDFVML